MEKRKINSIVITILSCCILSVSCDEESARHPEYQYEITLDDDLNVIDLGRAGQSTPDGMYYYSGQVTLFSPDGSSRTFQCLEGKNGMDAGCRGAWHYGYFYNLDRNKWVTIGGVKYRGSK